MSEKPTYLGFMHEQWEEHATKCLAKAAASSPEIRHMTEMTIACLQASFYCGAMAAVKALRAATPSDQQRLADEIHAFVAMDVAAIIRLNDNLTAPLE